MDKKTMVLLLAILFFFTGVSGILPANETARAETPVQIRLSLHVPETHMIWKDMLLPWTKAVEKESKGKLAIKPYLGGVLHGASDGFKAVRGDVTDMAMCYPVWSPAGFHLNHVTGLPFAFPNASVAAMVTEQLYPKYLKDEYEKKEIYLAFYSSMATYDLISSKPVQKMEDMKGMKVRTPAGPMADVAKRLGAVPVTMSIAEVYTALQRGMIDAVLTPYFTGYAYRFFEIAKYATILDVGVSASAWGLNRKTFDSLPPDLKREFYNLLRQGSQYWAQAMDEQNNLARERKKEGKVQVIQLSPDELKRWKAAVAPIWDDFIKENEERGLPAKELVAHMNELTAKYSTMSRQQLMELTIKSPVQGIIDFK